MSVVASAPASCGTPHPRLPGVVCGAPAGHDGSHRVGDLPFDGPAAWGGEPEDAEVLCAIADLAALALALRREARVVTCEQQAELVAAGACIAEAIVHLQRALPAA